MIFGQKGSHVQFRDLGQPRVPGPLIGRVRDVWHADLYHTYVCLG